MSAGRDPPLRDLFSMGAKPAGPTRPETWRLDAYLATDGAFRPSDGRTGIGGVIEGADGKRLDRWSLTGSAESNVIAEYDALIHGLERASMVLPGGTIGVLVDLESLCRYLNKTARFVFDPDWHDPVDHRVPDAVRSRWRDVERTIANFDDVRTATVSGGSNPAHRSARLYLDGPMEQGRAGGTRNGADDKTTFDCPTPSSASPADD